MHTPFSFWEINLAYSTFDTKISFDSLSLVLPDYVLSLNETNSFRKIHPCNDDHIIMHVHDSACMWRCLSMTIHVQEADA